MPKKARKRHSISRLKKVIARTGLSKSSIYKLMGENRFPKPISLGGARAVGWIDEEIDDWLYQQIEQSRRNSEIEASQLKNPISNECRIALDRLATVRRQYHYIITPEFSDALDDAMEKLRIAVDMAVSEISDDD